MKFHELLGAAFNSWYVECSNGLVALAKAGGDPDQVDWDEVAAVPKESNWSGNYGAEELRDVTVGWLPGVLAGDADLAGVYIDIGDTAAEEAWAERPTTEADAWAEVLKADAFFLSGDWR